MTKQLVDNIGEIEVSGSKKGPGVLVLHAWWGLNEFITQFCQRLTKEGFFVIAPDMYNKKIANTIKQAEEYVEQVDNNALKPIILNSVDYLLQNHNCTSSKISVIGFSFGAAWASWVANTKSDEIEKAVIFYGTGETNFSSTKASFLCHFAEEDPYEDPKYVKHYLNSLKEAGVNVQDYTYPGTHHWFFESDKKDYFKEEASTLAWQRTLEFLKSNS